MTAAKKPVSLAGKLAAAIGEVDRIGRDGTNDHFKYRYTSAEQVYRVVRGPLLEQGLTVIPSIRSSHREGQLTTLVLNLRIIDTDTGETLEAEWVGEGQDKGDKAAYKAATGAMKTWLKHLFMLPADDDPEADPGTDEGFTLARLNRVGSKLDDGEKKRIGEWMYVNGEPEPNRLRSAIEKIEAGETGGLLDLIGAAK